MRFKPTARTSVFTESVIREMTRLSQVHGAINLAQGYPDFPAPDFVKKAAIDAISDDVNQYAITWGAFRLRKALAQKYEKNYGFELDPDTHLTVTCGATEAMMAVMLAFIEPGDEVVIFEPYYENYIPDAAMSGATVKFVTLNSPDFSFDPLELREAFSSKTKAIIVNTPNNPSGKVFTHEELKIIADLCLEYDCLAITDEIYEHIIFDSHEHVSLASLPGMFERTVIISGISKTFSVTGWRIGYVLAAQEISAAVRKVHDYLTVGAPAPLQEAAAFAIEQGESYYPSLIEMYQKKRDFLLSALREAGFECHTPEGAYYIMADFTAHNFQGTDVDFSHHLIRDCGIAPVPGSSFYSGNNGNHFIRFTFSKSEDTLAEAVKRLARL